MAVQRFSRIPFDVWIALAIALYILLIADDSFMSVFVCAYIAMCAYVVMKTFTES